MAASRKTLLWQNSVPTEPALRRSWLGSAALMKQLPHRKATQISISSHTTSASHPHSPLSQFTAACDIASLLHFSVISQQYATVQCLSYTSRSVMPQQHTISVFLPRFYSPTLLCLILQQRKRIVSHLHFAVSCATVAENQSVLYFSVSCHSSNYNISLSLSHMSQEQL